MVGSLAKAALVVEVEGSLVSHTTNLVYLYTMVSLTPGLTTGLICLQQDQRCLLQGYNLLHHTIEVMDPLLMSDKAVQKVLMAFQLLGL